MPLHDRQSYGGGSKIVELHALHALHETHDSWVVFSARAP